MSELQPKEQFEKGVELYTKRQFQQAIDILLSLTKEYPKEPDYWKYLGLSYRHLKRHHEAEKSFTQLIELEPGKPWNYFLRGRARYGQQNYQSAIEDFDRAEELEMDDEEFYGAGALYELFMLRADCYEQLKQYERAISDYSQYSHYSGRHYIHTREAKRLRWKILLKKF